MSDVGALQGKVSSLTKQLADQAKRHDSELENLRKVVQDLQLQTEALEKLSQANSVISAGPNADVFTRNVDWTINNFSSQVANLQKGGQIWSPKFNAAGLQGVQLEFFPKGRENTTFDGFCSLFLWVPEGIKLKYQLRVGSFFRAPDVDEYEKRIGHGHSNFCPLQPEVDEATDSITLGVNLIEVLPLREALSSSTGTISYLPTSMESILKREVEVFHNRNVNKVVWRITKVSERLKHLPRGASMWTRLFSAAGIREMLLEFYPNGSTNTTKDGFCGFYIRCPEGVTIVVTLIVGNVKKGPIKTTFDSLTGKGLPDFCLLQEQIGADDTLDVGLELTREAPRTLQLEG